MILKIGSYDIKNGYFNNKQILRMYGGNMLIWEYSDGTVTPPPSSDRIDKFEIKASDLMTMDGGMYYYNFDMDSTYFKENFPYMFYPGMGGIFFVINDFLSIGYYMEQEDIGMTQGEFEGADGYFYSFNLILDFEIDPTFEDLLVPSPGKVAFMTDDNSFDTMTFLPITAITFPIYYDFLYALSSETGVYSFTKQPIDFTEYTVSYGATYSLAYARIDGEQYMGYCMKQTIDDTITGEPFEFEAVQFVANGNQFLVGKDVHLDITTEDVTYAPGETLVAFPGASFTKFELVPASEFASVSLDDTEPPVSTYSLRNPLLSIINKLEELKR